MRRVLGILLIAFSLAIVLRLFVFDTISVASHAMHESYSVGDRLIIEKWSLGPRMPQSLKLPFSSKIKSIKRPWLRFMYDPYRFPGFSSVKINDLIVFNDPRLLPGTPSDLSPTLLSRCAGLPGDTVETEGPRLLIDGKEFQRSFDVTTCFQFLTKQKSNVEKRLMAAFPDREIFHRKDTSFVFLTQYEFMKLVVEDKGKMLPLEQYISTYDVRHIVLPYKGYRFMLNKKNLDLWRDLLNRYEKTAISRSNNGKYEINGKEANSYTFKQNYYWLLNDHQGYLNDSRTIGPVPESFIIGKACLLLYSPVKKRLLQKI